MEKHSNKVVKMIQKHNQSYADYIAKNKNLDEVWFDDNRYHNDTLTNEQVKWLDKWIKKYEELQNLLIEVA